MKSLKKATGWIIAGVAALLIIVAATSATTIVPAGHAGVVVPWAASAIVYWMKAYILKCHSSSKL